MEAGRLPLNLATSRPGIEAQVVLEDDIVQMGNMASSLPPYHHAPLATDRTQIRLLKILSSAAEGKDQVLTLSLDMFDLESAPAYTALSYEWGPKDNPSMVVIGGALLPILRNLQTFMETYSEVENLDKYFWIDQISINQNHTEERSAQVSHMFEIFSKAEEIIAWVGSHPLSGVLSEAISMIADFPQDDSRRHRLWLGKLEDIGPSPLAQHHASALTQFTKLTYWGRTWVAQELMSTSQARVMYGSHFLDFEEVEQLSNVLGNDYREWQVDWQAYAAFQTLFKFRRIRRTAPAASYVTWLFAVGYCAFSHCEDLRDKVYAVQNLFPDRFQVPLNYRLSLRDVFMSTAINCIWQTRHYAEFTQSIDAGCVQGINSLAIAMGFHTTEIYGGVRHQRLLSRLGQVRAVLGWDTQKDPSKKTGLEEERLEAFNAIARMAIDEYLADGAESKALTNALTELRLDHEQMIRCSTGSISDEIDH